MKEMRKLNKGSKRILLHPHWVFISKELLLESNLKKNQTKQDSRAAYFQTAITEKVKHHTAMSLTLLTLPMAQVSLNQCALTL